MLLVRPCLRQQKKSEAKTDIYLRKNGQILVRWSIKENKTYHDVVYVYDNVILHPIDRLSSTLNTRIDRLLVHYRMTSTVMMLPTDFFESSECKINLEEKKSFIYRTALSFAIISLLHGIFQRCFSFLVIFEIKKNKRTNKTSGRRRRKRRRHRYKTDKYVVG